MSESVKRPVILNLAGALTEEFVSYFAEKDIRIIDSISGSDVQSWTHILVRNLDNFDGIGDTYNTLGNDIKLISLSTPRDLKNFMMNNGKLIYNESWLSSSFGFFLLNKFFSEYGGVNLPDSYPKFKELGSFKITNPFATGDYLDHLVYNAFENGMSGLSIKTYFDHILMYLTSVKNKGKVSFPIEVSYGIHQEVYGLQMHFYAHDLQIEDVTNSLSSSINKTPEEYLLYISLQSSDFFDFTYLPEVKKVVLTGLWTKNEAIKSENKGLMFTHSMASESVFKTISENTLPFVLNQDELEDISQMISPAGEMEVRIIPANNSVDEEFRIIPAHEVVKPTSQPIKENDSLEEALDEILELNGDMEKVVPAEIAGMTEEERVERVKALQEEVDVLQRVLGAEEKEAIDDQVKGLQVEIEELQNIKGPELDNETVSRLQALQKQMEVLQKIKGLEQEQESIARLKALKQEIETIRKVKGSKTGEQDARNKILTRIAGDKRESERYQINGSSNLEEKKGNLTVRTLGTEETAASYEFAGNEISDHPSESSGAKKAVPLFKVSGATNREKELETRMEDIQAQNGLLKQKLVTVMSELKVQKDTHARLLKVKEDVQKTVILPEDAPSKLDEILPKDTKNLTELEIRIAEEFRQMERLTRKAQLESVQKDVHFTKEMEKLQRLIALKDSIVDKSRDNFTKAMEKKDQEIGVMKIRLDQANKHMSGGSVAQSSIKELERQAQNQNKMIEMYKAKISTLSSTIESSKAESNSKDELKKVQLLNDQMRIQLEAMKRDVSKYQERASSDTAQLLTLKQDKAKLQDSLKKAEQATRISQAQNHQQQSEMEVKRLNTQVQLLETYLKESNSKVRDLEMKLQTATAVNRNNVAAEDGQSKAKIGHLENSVKKLTQDLVESRNLQAELKKETNKLRQEKTSLQNTLDKTKKDLEKYEKKPASPKKAG